MRNIDKNEKLKKVLMPQNLQKLLSSAVWNIYQNDPEAFILRVENTPALQEKLIEQQKLHEASEAAKQQAELSHQRAVESHQRAVESHQRAVESHQRAEQSSKEYDEALQQQREVHQATTKGRCDDLVTMVNYDLEHRLGDAQISEDLRRILHPVPQAWLDEIREYMTHAHPDVAQYLFSHCPEVFLSSVPQQQQYSQQQVQYMQHNNNVQQQVQQVQHNNNVQHVQCNVPHNTNQYSATLLMEQQHNNMQQQIQHVQQAQHMQQQSHHNNTHELQQQHTTCTDELQHTETGGCTGCEIF